MNQKIGILFAGQGAQYPGMGADLYEHSPQAREIFTDAGEEIRHWCFEGDKETLRQTHITQPCLYTVTMAAYAALRHALDQAGLLPQEGDASEESPLSIGAMAGFSLGEYMALAAAGSISDLATGLRIVTLRGQYMEEAGLGEDGTPRGGMVAAFGDTQTIEETVQEVRGERILAAVNYNNPRQTVVAGELAALEDFTAAAKEHHLKTKRLSVSTAFHCAMMAPAAERLAPVLREAAMVYPRYPLYSNITARDIMADYTGSPSDDGAVGNYLAEIMARQVACPVYFESVIRHMIEDGVSCLVEVGPGNTLSGFARKISHEVPAFHVENKETLEETVEALQALTQESV